MAKFLIEVNYTAEGARGVMKDGGSKRREAAKAAIKSIGGKIESFYFAFGDVDAYVIFDAPDNVSAAAASTALNSSGAVQCRTIVLLTTEEIDEAVKKTVKYRAPGQ